MRFSLLLFLCLTGLAWASSAQTRIDPSFLPQRLYEPAAATAALQLSNGSRLVFGVQRAEHQEVPGMAAYLPNGQLDTQFQANLAAATWTDVKGAAEAPGGKIWVVAGRVAYGSTTYFQLVRLNPDGTRDASFAPRTSSWGTIYNIAAQSDGKVVVGGSLLRSGSTVPAAVLRLNADGTPDTAFDALFAANTIIRNASLVGTTASALVLQPNGKLVLALYSPFVDVIRLNADGSQDTSFQLRQSFGSPPVINTAASVGSLALQPDGQILVGAANSGSALFVSYSRQFFRLSATGVIDGTFAPLAGLCPQRPDYMVPTVQVRPSGQILFAVAGYGAPQLTDSQRYVAQLLANGSLDPSWQFPAPLAGPYSYSGDYSARSVHLLASGQVLVAGGLLNIDTPTALATGVHLLQATGAVAPFVAPLLQISSNASTLVVQPSGQILVSGRFSEINGVATVGLARLQADGSTDTGFAARSPFATALPSTLVYPLYTYPDGRMLVGGTFSFQANGQQHINLVRLLANGRLDSTFVSTAFGPSSPYGTSMAPNYGRVQSANVQPTGNIVVLGVSGSNSSLQGQRFLARLTDTGQMDAAFQSAVAAPNCLLMRADGRLLVGAAGATGQAAIVTGLLANGNTDPAFTPASVTNGTAAASINQLAQAPSGKFMLMGNFTAVGTVATARIGQLTAAGVPDPGFVVAAATIPPTPFYSTPIFGIAVQPNGRVLVGGISQPNGQATAKTLLRLLPTGALDTGFGTNVQPDFVVFAPVIQPDGAILAPGLYTSITGQLHIGLARLLDDNVLTVHSQHLQLMTAAYPVPAHNQLHLRLDAAAQPKTVLLLDALGRPVLSQKVVQPEMQLATGALAPGVYLLRVEYATGTVTRRVVLE